MPTRPRHDRCQRYPRFDEKSRGKKYWCGAGNTATLPPAVFAASVLWRTWTGWRSARTRADDRLQRARGVVIRNLGAHVVAGRAIGRRAHVEPGVVVVGDVGLVGREHRFLLNQPAPGIERVRDRALEAAHAHAVEHELDALADAASLGAPQA